MRTSVASLTHKMVALCAVFALACSMVPVAWADEGSAATAAGIAAGSAAEPDGADSPEGASSSEDAAVSDAPEASAQSADAKAAGSGSAGPGTTVSIQVYRSSYPLVWDLNDAGSADVTKAQWESKPAAWPTEGSPGSAVGKCDGYVPWTDDANPGSEPSRLGFNFMGWSTKPDIAVEGTGKLDTLSIPKDAPIVEGPDGVKRITLYALWAPVEYSVVFDLTKNPEDASAVPSFNWVDGEGNPLKGADGFSDLGGGRYRLSGVTLEDYDPATGLIEIATPARGTGGYRFLSWAEPDSQQDPAVAVMKSGSSKWFVNPVALPHYDYEPVLTARWALSFDVDVPSQVTFDQYDSLEVEGNLTDTTEKGDIDEESSDLHDKGKQAHFCSQSTASDYKIVALKSVRQPTAEKVLTTSDSSKASPEEVLGGTDADGVEHEGEKLLSLFAQGATAEEQGVHFKLDDAIDMDDSARYGAFTIPKQTKAYADADYSRDDEERLCVSYRLNLDNNVDGATEPNHGLVVAKNVNEGDRTPIAEVSYEFAVADAEVEAVSGDALYIKDGNKTYGLSYIKAAADDLSANGTSSKYYAQFKGWLDAQVMTNGNPGPGPYFQLKVDGIYLPLQLIGICQDTKSSGGRAGLTFQMRDIYASDNARSADAAGIVGGDTFNYTYMNSSKTNSGGWGTSAMKATLNSTFWGYLPADLRSAIVGVTKYQQMPGGTDASRLGKTLNETVWLPSMYEVFGTSFENYNESEALKSNGSVPFQYMAYQGNAAASANTRAIKTYNGVMNYWWLRSAYRGDTSRFCYVTSDGYRYYNYASYAFGVAPCFCL